MKALIASIAIILAACSPVRDQSATAPVHRDIGAVMAELWKESDVRNRELWGIIACDYDGSPYDAAVFSSGSNMAVSGDMALLNSTGEHGWACGEFHTHPYIGTTRTLEERKSMAGPSAADLSAWNSSPGRIHAVADINGVWGLALDGAAFFCQWNDSMTGTGGCFSSQASE